MADCRLVRSSRSGRSGSSAVKSLNLSTFSRFTQTNYLNKTLKFYTAQTRKAPRETVLIRIRTGFAGHSEWMNELQVYLLPNFKHKNILQYFRSGGRDFPPEFKRGPMIYPRDLSEDDDDDDYDHHHHHHHHHREPAAGRSRAKRIKLEYWLMNKYTNCTTLREFLHSNILSWPKMLDIALGIARGLHFLHEYCEYQSFNPSHMMDRYVRSTNGRLKKISFIEQNNVIRMQPYLTIAVIHRNLSSINVALKADLTPCIWNFGLSYIHHPFQPANHRHLIEFDSKNAHLESQYSPPEILQETGHLSLVAMKSVDMYACGILLWELISRCVLPEINDADATDEERAERKNPDHYYEPFQQEFGDQASRSMLKYAVCKVRARPRVKNCWLVGRKTNRFAQTMQDLWDNDFDARLQATTLSDRLTHLSRSNRDRRNRYSCRTSRVFDRATMWPPEGTSTQAPPFPVKCGPNILIESISCSEESSCQDGDTQNDDSELELSLVEEQNLFKIPLDQKRAPATRIEPPVPQASCSLATSSPQMGPMTSSPKGFILLKRPRSRMSQPSGARDSAIEESFELSTRYLSRESGNTENQPPTRESFSSFCEISSIEAPSQSEAGETAHPRASQTRPH